MGTMFQLVFLGQGGFKTMSRIDSHISRVRNKLAMAEFMYALAQALLVGALLVLAYVVVRQFTLLMLPKEQYWLYGLLGAAGLYALVIGIVRRPSEIITAVAIDDRLKLHEKFSTALQVRSKNDPFSQAAVLDAEQTASSVDLNKKFPIVFPKPIVHAAWVTCVAAGLLVLIEPRNIFASETPKVAIKKSEESKETKEAREKIKQALEVLEMQPKGVVEKENIQIAKASLMELARSQNIDPESAKRKAQSALQDVNKAIKEHIKDNQKFADAKNNQRMMEKLEPGPEDKGPIAEAQRQLAQGNVSGAMEKLDETVKKFDQMNDEQKEKAAQQMQNMANQLQKMANDPKQQQQMQQKLQQMGMNQQQAQQAMQAMQQAAQGNQQAQQQLQNMAQQAMQQMNNGAGATPQQQQQVQQMLQQLQGQANTQQTAQAMQQAAQQMAQAMQQAAQGQNGQQQGQNQQANGQQQGQQGQQGNQGQQSNQGQNSQQNGQQAGGQTPQQQMANANQQMQQQMQNLQAAAQDAQQVAAAQQAAQQAANGGQGGQQANAGQQGNQGQGDNGMPPGQKQGQGQGGAGIGQGGNIGMAEAPFTVKQEVSKSKDNEKGKIIAASLVKAEALKGESKAEIREISKSMLQDATDEVDSERVSRQGQNVVKDYFGQINEDASK